jgi:twinkle protein
LRGWADFGLSLPDTFSGEQYSTCPACSPQRKKKTVKCLSANGDKLTWVCHHCGWSGTLKEGVDHKSEPWKYATRRYRKPAYTPKPTMPATFAEWFRSRGISEDTLRRNRISVESVYMPQVEDFVQAARFPFYRNGEVVNIKSRDLSKNFRLETNAERIFYGMDDVTGETAIIVEGEMDKLALEEAGFRNCLSVPDGAPAANTKDYSSKFSFLENCEEFLLKIKVFILAVDSDEPGQKLEEELARRLGKYRCKRVRWPEGCKDANDVLLKHGKEELSDRISHAQEYPIEGIFEVSDIEPQIDALYRLESSTRGERTGWASVDQHYTVRIGEFTVVTGIPGHGKSEWLDALMVNLSSQRGWIFAVFSPENQPLERHFVKLAEKLVEKPFFPGHHQRMSAQDLQGSKALLGKWFTFILPPENELTVDGILELAQHVILKKGVKGMVIDPWNEIDHTRPSNMTETEYISYCLTKIRRFARNYSLHIWLVAHPTKLRKQDNGKYPVPTAYDISGSAAWRNKADNCITVFRHIENDLVEIHVQKIRFKEVGRIGMVTLKYDNITGRYHE